MAAFSAVTVLQEKSQPLVAKVESLEGFELGFELSLIPDRCMHHI